MIAGFCARQYNPLVKKTSDAQKYPFLSQDVIDYMNNQQAATKTMGLALADHITGDLPFSAKPDDPCACANRIGSESDNAPECGSFEADREAILMAFCVMDSLNGANPTCPSF